MRRILICFLAFILILLYSCASPPDVDTESSEAYDEPVILPDNEKIIIYPEVKNMTETNQVIVLDKVEIISDETTNNNALDLLKEFIKANGIEINANARVKIYLGSKNEISPEGEGYYINTTGENMVISSSGNAGQHYAVLTFRQMLYGNKLKMAEIEDSPAFPIRGVVEGFYGKPWSNQNRLSIIEFLGKYKMNTYMYAPKDDPKHREKWREPYTDKEKKALGELIDTCKRNYVNFVYAISPGLDMDFGSGYEADKAKLIEKCDMLYALGVRHFALLLDDLPVRTAETASYHARLVNDFREEFYAKHTDLAELITIFAEYLDTAVTAEYTNTVAVNLNDKVLVMWTGPSIDLKLSMGDFDKPNSTYGRKMLLWWNYPVNDWAPNHLFTDGVKNLSKNLVNEVCGFLSNPMNQAEAAKIPLFTLANYLWNPDKYSYKDSFHAAINTLHPETFDSVLMFSENSFATNLNGDKDSTAFARYINSFIIEYNKGETGKATDTLYDYFTKLQSAVAEIREKDKNEGFINEISPWLDKAADTAAMGISLIDALRAEDEKTFWEKAVEFYFVKERYDTNSVYFSKDVIAPFLNDKAPAMLAKAGEGLKSKNPLEIKTTVSKLKATASSSLGSYQNYRISYATDDDDKTYYWSASSATEGYWIKLDLGKVTHVHNIVLKSGCDAYGLDYIRRGQMQYSVDGVEWVNVGEIQTSKLVALSGLDIQCRYVRYISVSKQDYWMSVSDFAVNVEETCPEITGNPFGEYGHEAFRMFDNDLSTFYRAEIAPAEGEHISINNIPEGVTVLKVLQSTLCGADVVAVSGDNETILGSLDGYYNTFTLTEGVMAIVFKWKGNVIPHINEVTFR